MHIHRQTLQFAPAACSLPWPIACRYTFTTKTFFVAHFLRLNFPFLPFSWYFSKGGGGCGCGSCAERLCCVWGDGDAKAGPGGNRQEAGAGGLAKRLAHVYFTLQFRLRCISHSLPSTSPPLVSLLLVARSWPAPADAPARHVAGVILILHLAFSFCLCYCCSYCCCCCMFKKVDKP